MLLRTISEMEKESIYLAVVAGIFIIISGYWIVVSVKRVILSKRCKKATERNLKIDPTDYISEQYNYHYQTEICKYVLLILTNIAETSISSISCILCFLEYHYSINKDNIYREELESCTSINNSIIIEFQLIESSVPLLTVIRALRDVTELFGLGLLIYLMSYLMRRMRYTGHTNVRRYICTVSIISLVIVLTSFSTFLLPLCKSIFLLAITYTCVMFLIYANRFKKTLLHRAIERLVQHGSNRREMLQYKYFSYTINFIIIGICLIGLAIYLGVIARIMISFIFFGKCVLPTSFMPQLIDLETLSNEQVMKIFTVFSDMDTISSVLACIGFILLIFPLVSITIIIWIQLVYRMFRGNSSVQIRYRNASNFDDSSISIKLEQTESPV